MTEPTASPDVTGLIERLTRASKRMKEALDREVMPDPTEINNLLLMAQFRFEEAAGVLLALRQEVERLREDRDSQQREAIKALERATAAEASLRLAIQRQEDAHEIAGRLREIVQKGMDRHPDYDTDRQIYGAMHMQVLRLLEWDVSARAALALQPKEN